MRCDLCPLSDPEDVCPEAEGKFGIEHKDGVLGCKHPRSWVEKRDEEYCNHLCEMGLDMGIEMDLTDDELDRVIEICEHMVGLDYNRPYHRHGKAFYKAYRNYYEDVLEGNCLLDKLPDCLFAIHRDDRGVTYQLTQTGLAWLGRQLHITITWDDVVWTSADGNTDVTLDCEYELDNIEVDIEGETYIVEVKKDHLLTEG